MGHLFAQDPGLRQETGVLSRRARDPARSPALRSARVVDSWDATFKDTKDSDYVVGQRWAVVGVMLHLEAP